MDTEVHTPTEGARLAFSLDEYRRRFERMQSRVADRGLDALLSTSLGNICWLTGFQTLASYGFALYAALVTFISTEHFTVWLSISGVAMVVVGGLGSIAGSFLGAAFVVLLPELLRGAGDYQQLVYGVAMIVVFIAWPSGLMGGLLALQRVVRRAVAPTAPGPALMRLPPGPVP